MSALTKTQVEAYTRRRNFHLAIEQKAAELAASSIEAPPHEVKSLEPESLAAETDPPKPPAISQPPGASAVSYETKPVAYPSIAEILEAVANYFRVSVMDLKSARRTHDVVLPRHIAMYLSKELTPFSLPVIGRHIGGKDHTTVLNGVRKVTRLVQTDREVAFNVVLLLAQITRAAQ
jgi:hypothetical protein